MLNREIQSDRKNKNIIGMMQSCLILILVVLIIMIMVQITRLQGTARVINYAGLVRGDTQRMVKLEITGSRSDELIKYLDDIPVSYTHLDVYKRQRIYRAIRQNREKKELDIMRLGILRF